MSEFGSKPEKLRIANGFRFAPESGLPDLRTTPAANPRERRMPASRVGS
jgi:hypothetical protein